MTKKFCDRCFKEIENDQVIEIICSSGNIELCLGCNEELRKFMCGESIEMIKRNNK